MIDGTRDENLSFFKEKLLQSDTKSITNFENKGHQNRHKEMTKYKIHADYDERMTNSVTKSEIKMAKLLAIIVFGVGIVVTIGWIFNIPILESVLPNMVTMKFSTAVSFICSGVILYFISKMQDGKLGIGEIVIAASGMVIFLLMVTLLVSNLTGIYTGVERLFVKEIHNEHTAVMGRPSLPTMIDFIMVVLAGIFSLSNYVRFKKLSFWIGLAILVSGGISLIGYAVDLPFLYYYIPGWNSGMALHTSLLFVLSGIALMILKSHYAVEHATIRSVRLRTKLISLFLTASVLPTVFVGILIYNLAKSSEPITTLGNGIVMLVSVTIFGVIVFALITSKFLSEPITRLKKATESISEENLEAKVEGESSDEIGDLGKSFNQMIKNLKIARDKLVSAEQLELSEKIAISQYQELKKIYETLSTTEKKYRNLYEYSPDLLRSISENGFILDCNDNYAKSLGYTKDEVIGTSIFEHTAKKSLKELSQGIGEWKKTGKIINRTIWLKRKDNSEFPTLLSGTNLYDETGAIVGRTVSLRDMTEIYTAKEALEGEKAKRLMTIGELSSRLSHDIRNPLSVIHNVTELLRLRYPNKDEKELSLIDTIDKSALRISYQIEDVLNFVRSTDIKKEFCSILQILKSCVDKITLPDNVKIIMPTNDLQVDCDKIKLEIVFENIISNAIQAVDEQPGEITIKIRNELNDDVIEVSDSGHGIPLDVLPQIFEPLFTTKRSGTGLGLPTCKNLIEQHGWTIQVKLPSTFVIKIPHRQ
ncbi:MAG: ATP-binding protein [Nitrosotalea sp.]